MVVAISKSVWVEPYVFRIVSLAHGDDVPIPVLPSTISPLVGATIPAKFEPIAVPPKTPNLFCGVLLLPTLMFPLYPYNIAAPAAVVKPKSSLLTLKPRVGLAFQLPKLQLANTVIPEATFVLPDAWKVTPVPVPTPLTDRVAVGVEDPTPTFPLASTVKSDVPVEEATLNGFWLPDPCTLKVIVDDVALTPATIPLSRRIPVANVVAPVYRAENPLTPPDTAAPASAKPKVDVATQRVDVPVVCRSIPLLPIEFTAS